MTNVWAHNNREIITENQALAECDLEIEVPEDITLCQEESISLDGIIHGDYLRFEWTQEGTFLTDSDLDPDVFIDGSTSFTLTAYQLSENNLIVNGDFESSDWIEYTDYMIGINSCYGLGFLDCEGTYGVIDNPQDGHSHWSPCPDHTGGGDMMVVNGAPNYQQIWCQTINVDPDGLYQFSAWVTSVSPNSPADLQFAIDGTLIGNIFSLSSSTCSWEEFEAEWEASGQTSVEICITNQNTAASGNDFALDDISFQEICVEEASFNVTFSEFDVSWTTPEELTCELPITEISLEIEPINDYDIIWDTNQGEITNIENDGQLIFVEASGDYLVTVTDMVGCSQEFEIEVDAEQENPELYIEESNQIDCINDSAEIEIDSDQNGIEYEWKNEAGEVISYEDELLVNHAGIYSVIAINPQTGCTSYDTAFIIADTIGPVFNLVNDFDLNCFNEEVLIHTDSLIDDVLWSGPPQFIPPHQNDSLTVSTPGIYYAEVVFMNGCKHIDSIEVLELTTDINYSTTYDSLINCFSPVSEVSIELNSQLLEMQWFENPLLPIDSISIDSAGVYYYAVFDSIGCSVLDSIVVRSDFLLPDAELISDTIECANPEAIIQILDPDSTFHVEWQFAGQSSFGDSLVVNADGEVTYILKGSNGCSINDTIEIYSSEDFPELTIEGDSLNCINQVVTLTAISDQSNLLYQWFDDLSSMIHDGDSINVSTPGIYTLEGSNEEGCISYSTYEVVADTQAPSIMINDPPVLNCIDSIVHVYSLQAEENLIYNWDGPGGTVISDTILVNLPGYYELTVTAQNGCTSTSSVQIEIDTIVPEIIIEPLEELNCNTTIVTPLIDIDGPYDKIKWTGPNLESNEDMVDLSESGVYTIELTALNGCVRNESFVLTEDYSLPDFDYTSSIIDCNNPLSHIEVLPSTEIESILYFDNNQEIGSGNEIEVNYTENLTVSVTGINGCSESADIKIEVDTSSISYELSSGMIDCNQNPVFINVITQAQDYNSAVFNMAGEHIGSTATEIFEAGHYTVELTGDNGCVSKKDIIIEEISDFPYINDFKINNFICTETVAIEDFSITGGQAPYSIFLDGDLHSNSSNEFIISGPGWHDIMIEDDNGCTADTSIFIEEVLPIEAYIIPEISIMEGESFQLELMINLDTNDIESIEWSPSDFLSCHDCTDPIVSAPINTDYTIYVKAKNGCEASTNLRVKVEKQIKYFIPNIITITQSSDPNSWFTIYAETGDIDRISELHIFDRWGNLVFQNFNFQVNQPESGWNGHINDSKAE